jgi:nitroimidazol reductase NimA-like FMN-containing flavoprotein (pyridoxamine 5'-phosphate oxidase superfamily)
MAGSSHPDAIPRRRDRTVDDDEWIRAFLTEAPFGVIATVSDGQPHLHPMVFVFDGRHDLIYFHGARKGRLFANIEQDARVCFNASAMGSLRPGDKACNFDAEYESVIVFGRAHVVADEAEATRALRLLLDKYHPDLEYGEDYQPIDPARLAATAVYRLQIDAWSGKRNAPDI